MAVSIKRMTYAEEAGFQKRVGYYFWYQANAVLNQETPDATELAFAKAVYAGKVSKKDMCLTVITNSSIGTAIDSNSEPSDSDIEWAVTTNNQFGNLAKSYDAVGLI